MRTAIILLLFGLTTGVYAQEIPKKDSTKNTPSVLVLTDAQKLLPQIAPQSPQVAAMERHGNYAVKKYNGLVDISLPIFQIKVGNISVPISLAYHPSGNKVNDVASQVGLGWSLNAGGQISRTLTGLPDENTGAYLDGGLDLTMASIRFYGLMWLKGIKWGEKLTLKYW